MINKSNLMPFTPPKRSPSVSRITKEHISFTLPALHQQRMFSAPDIMVPGSVPSPPPPCLYPFFSQLQAASRASASLCLPLFLAAATICGAKSSTYYLPSVYPVSGIHKSCVFGTFLSLLAPLILFRLSICPVVAHAATPFQLFAVNVAAKPHWTLK